MKQRKKDRKIKKESKKTHMRERNNESKYLRKIESKTERK